MEKGKIKLFALSLAAYLTLIGGGCACKNIEKNNIEKNVEVVEVKETPAPVQRVINVIVNTPKSDNETIDEIVINDQDTIDNIENTKYDFSDDYIKCEKYAYLLKCANIFNDESFNNPIKRIDAYQKIYRIASNGTWDYVQSEDGTYGYMEPYLLVDLPENKYVEVDISEQKTKLYVNGKEIFSTSNVTGCVNKGTESDIGCFDIDDKQTDTNLIAYNTDGSLKYKSPVKYWMPYNYGEGLHDADNWRNEYGKDIYIYNGSHGCINMPLDATKYIFENVEIGDTVLVHK